jgi:hypothetical protein
MASGRIPDYLAATTPLTGAELMEIVQAGQTRKLALGDIAIDQADLTLRAHLAATGALRGAELVAYESDDTGADARVLKAKLGDVRSVLDFAGDDDTAFAAAAAIGGRIDVPPGDYNLSATVEGDFQLAPGVSFTGAGWVHPIRRGFWRNVDDGTNIHLFRDRVFVGDAVEHSGRISAPYGGTWLTDNVASWPEKNGQMNVLSSEPGRIAILAGAYCSPTSGSGGIGVAAFSWNNGVGTTSRGFYADVTHEAGAQGSYGYELAVTNRGADIPANAYDMDGGCIGHHITAVGSENYTMGDAATPNPGSTAPGTCAVNIAGGTQSILYPVRRWNLGIRFSAGSLTGSDGVTGTAVAISMAKGHMLQWMASAANLGAVIRSDVSSAAGVDVGLLFANNQVKITGTGEQPIATFSRDILGAGGVNYLDFQDARTGTLPTIAAEGSDATIGIQLQTKANGAIRLLGRDGAAESFRAIFGADYVNYVTAKGAVAAGVVELGADGSDTNIDVRITPKGTGRLSFGTHAAIAGETLSGYILIRDSGGVTRKLAVVA